MLTEITISSSVENVQAAMANLETVYTKQREAIDAEAKRQKKELLAYRIERRRALKRLLAVVETNEPACETRGVRNNDRY